MHRRGNQENDNFRQQLKASLKVDETRECVNYTSISSDIHSR
jgi:hypothetical protein